MSPHSKKFDEFSDRFEKHLSQFKTYLKKQASKFEPELRNTAAECIKPQGKYLRPMLVFASACGVKPSDTSLQNRAAIVELIHLASLIHDDVIDNASMRRNSQTVFKKFGGRTAILLGDAIFAHAMQLAFKEEDQKVWKMSVNAVKDLCEGEVRQSLACNHDLTMKRYLSIIEGKTATLFEFSCFMGASIVDDKKGMWSSAALSAGKRLGRAYQMYDDVCDWILTEKDSGKTVGTDLLSDKQTLPILVLLPKLEKNLAKKLTRDLPSCDPQEICALMKANNVVEDCAKIYDAEIEKARKTISKFSDKNEHLLKFCDAMSELMPHSWNG